jgi:anti-anti-sigma factor
MATSNKKNTGMGYDPLAWLAEEIAEPKTAIDSEAVEEMAVKEGVFNVSEDEDTSYGAIETDDSLRAEIDYPDSDELLSDLNDGDIEPAAEMKAEIPGGAFESAEAIVTLNAALSMQQAATLYEQLKKSYNANNALEINASQVMSIDTAALQVLVSLKKDALKKGKSVVFAEPSPRFIESAKLLGLREFLEIHE